MKEPKNIKYIEAGIVTALIAVMYSFYLFAVQFVGVNALARPVTQIVTEIVLVFGVLNLMPPINRSYLDYRYNQMSFERLRRRALVVLGIFINSLGLMVVCHVLFIPLAFVNHNVSQVHLLVAEVILFLFLFLYTAVNHAIYYSRLFVNRSSELDDAESAKLENDIKYLRAQFNPGLIQDTLEFVEKHQVDNKALARTALEQFSNALRYKIYEVNHQEVSLIKELESLLAYSKLRALVYHLRVELQIETVPEKYTIKPLLLHSIFDILYDCSSEQTGIEIIGEEKEEGYYLVYDAKLLACKKNIMLNKEFMNVQQEFENSAKYTIQINREQNNMRIGILFLN